MPDSAAEAAEAVPEKPAAQPQPLMEKLVSLAKRRGFFYQSSEIYGGIQGVYDFGPQSIFSPLQIHPTSVFRTPPASVSIAQHPPKLDVSGLC